VSGDKVSTNRRGEDAVLAEIERRGGASVETVLTGRDTRAIAAGTLLPKRKQRRSRIAAERSHAAATVPRED
jgi:hypothetical protein